MCNTLIATWRMALDGVSQAMGITDLHHAVQHAVINVENNPLYHSVGYGGLPGENGDVELDAAFMDGDSLNYGAVAATQNLKNPITVAKQLSLSQRNNVLAASGALKFALENGMELRDNRHSLALEKWKGAVNSSQTYHHQEAYDGHDTVCVLGRSPKGSVCAAVSTSGLFMKKSGRLGDSPIIGSGCYADSSSGAAAATGVGEDIMKGCLSWEIVRLMKQYSPQTACEMVVREHTDKMLARKGECGSISVIAVNRHGEWGAATNKDEFSFIVGESGATAQVWLSHYKDRIFYREKASEKWLADYLDKLPSGSGN
ncbi:TPA: isoaspartyl peptidase/L-asparaginase [Salmonella enterica]|nr:isoaspartyl peptidase/L-asparaginase [Salmonella enterica]